MASGSALNNDVQEHLQMEDLDVPNSLGRCSNAATGPHATILRVGLAIAFLLVVVSTLVGIWRFTTPTELGPHAAFGDGVASGSGT